MHDTTEFVHAIAWPLTTLIIFLILRTELQRFTKNVVDRIRSTNSISIGPRGFELKGLVRATPLPANVQTRKVAFTRFVRGLTDKAMLDAVSDSLNIPLSTDLRAQINDIILDVPIPSQQVARPAPIAPQPKRDPPVDCFPRSLIHHGVSAKHLPVICASGNTASTAAITAPRWPITCYAARRRATGSRMMNWLRVSGSKERHNRSANPFRETNPFCRVSACRGRERFQGTCRPSSGWRIPNHLLRSGGDSMRAVYF